MELVNIKEIILTTIILNVVMLIIKYIKSRNRSEDTIFKAFIAIIMTLILSMLMSIGMLILEKTSVMLHNTNVIVIFFIYIFLVVPVVTIIIFYIDFPIEGKKQIYITEPTGESIFAGVIPFITFFSIIKNIYRYLEDPSRTTLLIHIGILILILIITTAVIIYLDAKKRVYKNNFAYYIADLLLTIGIFGIYIGTYNILCFDNYKKTTATYTLKENKIKDKIENEVEDETENEIEGENSDNKPNQYYAYEYIVNNEVYDYFSTEEQEDMIGKKIDIYYKIEAPEQSLPKIPPVTIYLVTGTVLIITSKCIRTIKRNKENDKNE